MKKFWIILIISMIFSVGCKGKKKIGKLGIQVPTGQEFVSVDKPYIVVGVFEDSPAYNSGIRPDDIIVQINGVSLEGRKYVDIYENLLLGPPNVSLSILIKRKEKLLIFEVVRGE